MKNKLLSVVVSAISTFIFAEIFSIYHFGEMPTLLTGLYLFSLFSVFEYLFLTIGFILKKVVQKEQIRKKEIIARVLLFVALILILVFLIILHTDWLIWYTYSSPFYINLIVRSIEFFMPAIILIVVSFLLLRK